MGVPAFFRWLSKKYPDIVENVDSRGACGYPFDNLYLDMNGIIHPCTHPENKAAPETEEEMFEAIFEYIDMLMDMLRPQKVLYMAVDGVAPRAKMNQQRSRRFRAAKESADKKAEIAKIRSQLMAQGVIFPEKGERAHFDSNVITPGTQFMINLSRALQKWIDIKLSSTDPAVNEIWHSDLVVILSDASSPGEGEHKIMEYIRRQKSSPGYLPNVSHCLCGADADLIMLGLATHELDFTIIREEFKPNQPRPCEICGQYGHEMKECRGEICPVDAPPPPCTDPGFIFIRLIKLREHLEKEGVGLDIERYIDDFVFLCFFVGNDFLPHLPSLEIRENAIDRLVRIYKQYVVSDRSIDDSIYMTQNGIVNLSKVQVLLNYLGQAEDDIFLRRFQSDKRYRTRLREQKRLKEGEQLKQLRDSTDSPWLKPVPIGERNTPINNPRGEANRVRVAANNQSAANALRAMMRPESEKLSELSQPINPHWRGKRTSSQVEQEDEKIDDDWAPNDDIQLGTIGWKERYYYHKFDCAEIDDKSEIIAREYVIGLCWVLLYYYQGCPDWQWFYPYHYAPFASDFQNLESIEIKFNRKSTPFKPLEQLMSVFPAASSENLPLTWQRLMKDLASPIIDFYPSNFKVDLNGKMWEWMGVALLPFIDEDRLHAALETVYNDLTDDERERNSLGPHLIFFSSRNESISEFLANIFADKHGEIDLNPEISAGLFGKVKWSSNCSILYKNVKCLEFYDPVFPKDHIFPAMRLKGALKPQITSKNGAKLSMESAQRFVGRAMGRNSFTV